VKEVRSVAEQVGRDTADEPLLGPDEAARKRFRDFARRQREQ
jgi:hypothetical protein